MNSSGGYDAPDFSDKPDESYLKQYVMKHPDNKMAWYLLGKEYLRNGEQGKANFCFGEAGEIYLAFENPDGETFSFVKNAPAMDAEPARASRRRRLAARSWMRVAIASVWGLLLLLFIPPGELPQTAEQILISDAPGGGKIVELPELPPAPAAMPDTAAQIFLLPAGSHEALLKEMISGAALGGATANAYTVVARAGKTSLAPWSDWTKPPQLLFSAVSDPANGQVALYHYSKSDCACTPADSTAAQQAVLRWQQRQEETLVLSSAISAYRRLTGEWPKSIAQLQRDYPANLLPGHTRLMQDMFFPLLAAIRREADGQRDFASGAEGVPNTPAATGGQELKLLFAPEVAPQNLQIIVSKKEHRLALVSGSLIIRSYPVGLGGEKTPLGEFAISEKVMNPNGKNNGDFGSRGMTLSDTLFAIHGTNEPKSIGKDESLGCVRMLNSDVEELYDMVPNGTKVKIIDGGLPQETIRGQKRFVLPHTARETNPGKVYKWLN